MIHVKLLVRRLVSVPWLLAAGLVLGWSGEAEAQLALSVNPSSVREDAGETEVEVTVEVTDDTAVEADVFVLLGISEEGLNSRFRIRLTVLRIAAGEKRATGTITLFPVNDEIVDIDLPIEIRGTAGIKTVEPATITLIDDDKDSQSINLSADIVELNRFDGATEVAVTATLDGKVLRQATSFVLTIGDHPDLGPNPNADTNGDGTIDDADATKDNREAQRDLDYTVTLATLTIPRNQVSGTATITITPKNRLPGTIRVATPDSDANNAGIQIANGLTIRPLDIKMKKAVAATADAITLSQESVREDAGETTIELKVSLTNALTNDETVRLRVLSVGETLPSGDAVTSTPTRDVDYTLSFAPFIIPAGETEGTTTFTITPYNDTVAVARGLIYIQITVGDVSVVKTIAIADDDANSTSISLTATPTRLSEGAGRTDVAVTGTLDGRVFDQDVIVLLIIDPDPKDTNANNEVVDVAEATRDVDYTAVLRPLTIPAGAVSGTTTITIIPFDDGTEEGEEKIRLTVPYANRQVTAQYADGEAANLTVGTVDVTLRDGSEGTVPSFAAGAAIAPQTYTVGTAITSLVLPEATGDGDLTYQVSALPAGLSFDSATRTLSGTPAQATVVEVTYTATDRDGEAAVLSFAITVIADEEKVLSFAADAAIAPRTYTVGTPIVDLVLPEITDRDCHPAYSVSALPAGLWFNSATRTLSGTPTQATDGAVEVTYTAVDIDSGESVALVFTIEVNPAAEVPRVVAAGLMAAPAMIREDAAETEVSLTFILEAAAAADESVQFAIVAPSEGTAAMRDVDYTVLLEVLITIPAGATEGTATLILAPINDNSEEGLEAIGVQATLVSTGQTLVTNIAIRDDETPSTSIALSADPSTLSENDDLTTVTITATLDGKALAADATVRLAIDNESTATRDLDYAALFTPRIEIPAGSITGTVNFYVDPRADNLEEGDEIIRLIGTIDGLEGDAVEIAISDPGAAKAVVQTRPEAFSLADNFPNPFNPATTIQYALPQAADVELTVYNIMGQPVRTLVAEYQSAGRYAMEWDATDDSGHSLSSGMYLYRLQVGGEFREVKKMLLLR
ncbi:MAG: T9SS type A sorting domain-containing protein [Gemmatimonadetes bacterium]|nr:T9SS type A sorting domain-containing protein [Gemmatimonadota bacterium]